MFRANCSTSWSVKLLALALAVTLAGCGFRLRGTYDVSPALQQVAVISASPYGDMAQILKNRLRASDVVVAEDGATDVAEIQLLDEVLEERTLSLFETGQVAEYELLYRLKVRIRSAGGDPLEQEVRVQRQYLDDPDKALAKGREKGLLLTEMREAAADRILRLMATYKG
ncbi:MAG: hypothetical protein II007_02500 [Gammaproteobacteria bacterium]|nr:hypothetical protein [Gammaproteobacteria bacterium]